MFSGGGRGKLRARGMFVVGSKRQARARMGDGGWRATANIESHRARLGAREPTPWLCLLVCPCHGRSLLGDLLAGVQDHVEVPVVESEWRATRWVEVGAAEADVRGVQVRKCAGQ